MIVILVLVFMARSYKIFNRMKKGIIKYSGYLLPKNVHTTYMINKGGDCGENKNFSHWVHYPKENALF